MKSYARRPVRGDINRLKSLKITLDDVLKTYLTASAKWEQNHVVSDVKILIGLVSIASTGIIVYMSLFMDFAVYKPYAIMLLSLYFALNIILEVFLFFWPEPVFKGTKGKSRLVVRSEVKSPHPVYTLTLYRDGSPVPIKYAKSFYDLFYSNGVLAHEEYLKDIEALLFK